MTPKEFKTIRDQLTAAAGLRSPNVVLAALMGVKPREVMRWAAGDRTVQKGRIVQLKMLMLLKKYTSTVRWSRIVGNAIAEIEELNHDHHTEPS